MMTFSWFPFSLLATLLFGIGMTFYKLPSAKQQNKFVATFWSLLIPTILAVIFFHTYIPLTTPAMLWVAATWGVFFACIVLLQMYALDHVDTNVLFPLTTTASLVITVLIGIFFFNEHVTLLQLLGIVLAIISIFLFLYKGGKLRYSWLLVSIGSGIILLSSFNKVLQKVVARNFDIHAFQIYQYLFASLFSFLVYIIIHRHDWKSHIFSGGMRIGGLIGIFSFFGGFSLYLALERGPFSLITSIHSLYVLITALTAYFLFKEKLTCKKILLLLLAIIAIILIRIG
jgi:drug/metabolite transporter (DMT)-like permease